MTGFPLPPVTQWRVRVVNPDGLLGFDRIVNDHLDGHVAQAVEVAWPEDRIVVEGRRRLNDYVGSPQWSEWEPCRVEVVVSRSNGVG